MYFKNYDGQCLMFIPSLFSATKNDLCRQMQFKCATHL